jgi:hypothetical protein
VDISLGEFLEHFFRLLQENKIPIRFRPMWPWHEIFYQLKKEFEGERNTPSFLSDLQFDWDSPHPESRELSELINAMCMIGIMETKSPRYDLSELCESTDMVLREQFPELDISVRQCLARAVEIAREEFRQLDSK